MSVAQSGIPNKAAINRAGRLIRPVCRICHTEVHVYLFQCVNLDLKF